VAGRAKKPLIVGGAAVAGVAGGLAVRRRTGGRRRSPLDGLSLPMRDGKLDFDAIASGAQRISEIGQQIGELASAADRAKKK